MSLVFAVRAKAIVIFSRGSKCPRKETLSKTLRAVIPSAASDRGTMRTRPTGTRERRPYPPRFEEGPLLPSFSDFLYSLPRLWRLRHHHALFEILHHFRLQAYFRGALRQRHLINLVLQLHQPGEQPFRRSPATTVVYTTGTTA